MTTIKEAKLKEYAAYGHEFTFDRPCSPLANWGKIDFATESYMGAKLFLSNGATKQATHLKGMRDLTGKIIPITVVRN